MIMISCFICFFCLVGKERLTGRSPMNSRNCLMSQPLIAGFSPHDLNGVHHVLVKIPRQAAFEH